MEFDKNSKGALERSLSTDSKRVVDIPYCIMVEERLIGPRAKYFINFRTKNDGIFRYLVEDRNGNIIGPEKAKIFFSHLTTRPRLLYKDDESEKWVEPDSYYPFSSKEFYEDNQNIYEDDEAGLSVKAIKSSVWHGIPTVAFKFMTDANSLIFSADTVYKPSLWKELYEEIRPQNFEKISRKKFEKSSIIYGDINDFIEKTWSRERYESALSAYDGSVIIHDVARKKSIVHTDYSDIADAPIPALFFIHSPDNLTSRRPILTSGKKIVLRNGGSYESVNGDLFSFDADIYIHHFSGDMVGYRSAKGQYKVIEKDGLMGVVDANSPEEGIMRVNLYQDIDGEYYRVLEDPKKFYCRRADGRVEKVTIKRNSSIGRVVKISKKRKRISS